ncbi:MAG: hypothetical protein KAI66_08225 [Lentisphaeria bacterium]|nr:hypothetical protein [Lentisphaeria bacterium]
MREHPLDLSYTTKHLWVRADDEETVATVGITQDLVDDVQDISAIDLPMVEDELEMDTYCVHLHLQNRIHHLRAPVTGRVLEINKDVLDTPYLLHVEPYEHWLYKMEIDDTEEFHLLMSCKQYVKFLDSL